MTQNLKWRVFFLFILEFIHEEKLVRSGFDKFETLFDFMDAKYKNSCLSLDEEDTIAIESFFYKSIVVKNYKTVVAMNRYLRGKYIKVYSIVIKRMLNLHLLTYKIQKIYYIFVQNLRQQIDLFHYISIYSGLNNLLNKFIQKLFNINIKRYFLI